MVLGAAQCGSGWGYAPFPLKAFRKQLERETRVVVLREEDYTSKKCSSCSFTPPAPLHPKAAAAAFLIFVQLGHQLTQK